jgi:hypothetical protein
MAPNVTLYAWAVPALSPGSPVDHTWVTTYDNRQTPYPTIQQVTAAHQNYWYCWGSFHAKGGTPVNPTGALGNQAGDLAFAQCLVAADLDSAQHYPARGTIFVYGIDGVCHQLANQVLYATRTGGSPPLTVKSARGYHASTFIYGTYGVNHTAWAQKIASCGGAPVVAAAGEPPVTAPPDDFEERARAVLGDDPALGKLLALRGEVLQFGAQRWPGAAAPNAEILNARNQHMLDQAAALLGPEKFAEIFGFRPGEKITLVDPTVQQR